MLATLFLSFVGLVAGAAQYCQFEDGDHPLTLCAAVNARPNLTASSEDWSITFGYQRIQKRGWGALGIGSGMYGALMFVTYAAEKSPQDLTLSVRRGLGYYEPELVEAEPRVVINAISLNESGWIETSFTCYGCAAWSSVNSGSTIQPWIWAANINQLFTDPSPDSTMDQHSYYGHFGLDMSAAKGDDATIPVIDFTTLNAANVASSSGSGSQSSTLFALHGVLLVLSVMMLYPCGILAIRGSSTKAFKNHVFLQLVASLGCIVGVLLAVYTTIANDQIGKLATPHVLLGLVVTTAVPLQIALGYVHHKRYVSGMQSPRVTFGHRWTGRLVVAGGCLNTLLGLRMAGASSILLIFTLTIGLIDVIILGIVARSSVIGKRESKTQSTEEDEDSRPFLGMEEE
ncbi:hypothetical protein F66182_3519 [Fusarium sp. NRRL 66182]|nr:hypothetical protein F66182_3519 [Fusarium sp. NRRL 66182]